MEKQSSTVYLNGIDNVKGFLIILVIIGHILQGPLNENIFRYIIYSFHMPLFLAVSGSLMNKKYLTEYAVRGLFKKYLTRMILPWFFAFIMYNFLANYKELFTNAFTVKSLINLILYPYYHLWYVPSLFIMIIALSLLIKVNISNRIILISSLTITLTWLIISEQHWVQENIFIQLLGDKRTYYFFLFFYVGYYIRNLKNDYKEINYRVDVILIVLFVVLRITDYFYWKNIILTSIIFTLLNICIIRYCISSIIYKKFEPNSILSKIGTYSLPIYLWHVAVIMISKLIFFEIFKTNIIVFYIGTSCLMAIFFIVLLKLKGRYLIFDRIIFGTARK
jgi:fucose 4-O-acetylase-like acetyltransferase